MTKVAAGLVLAAGEGRRYGQPKALVRGEDGRAWIRRASGVLRGAGIDEVYVVLGAAADEARELADPRDHVVVAVDWAAGMGASLRAGLRTVLDAPDGPEAVVVMLVDLPDVGSDVVERLLTWTTSGVLARATYDDVPGHPVLIGRDHWQGVVASATGDRGARDYLSAHAVTAVACGDLATGRDVDRP